MNRSEIAGTVLGLIATFLMPWPGAGSATQVEHAVQTEVEPASCVPVRSNSLTSATRASEVRSAAEPGSERG